MEQRNPTPLPAAPEAPPARTPDGLRRGVGIVNEHGEVVQWIECRSTTEAMQTAWDLRADGIDARAVTAPAHTINSLLRVRWPVRAAR